MANTFTQLDYHIVFSTKDRRPVLDSTRREELYRYIWGAHKNMGCKLHRIGGVEDHVHIFASLPTTLCIADFVKEVKTEATKWIKHEGVFPEFTSWQDGYGAFTVSQEHRDAVITYIKDQPDHHRGVSFVEEYKRLLTQAGISFDEQYL